MVKEYEVRYIEINKEEIIHKLEKIGAELKFNNFFKRYIFDLDETKNSWIRLRDEEDKVTLCYKKRSSSDIGDTEEIETTVEDFDLAANILKKGNYNNIYYQETKRTMYVLNGIEFCIDEWPKLKPMLEIESNSIEKVEEGIKLIGFESKEKGDASIVNCYSNKGIDLHSIKNLKFDK